MDKIAPYYKAVAGFLIPFLTQIAAALTARSDGGTTITQSEWLTAILTSLAAGGVVFAVPNKNNDPVPPQMLAALTDPENKDHP